MTKQAKPRLGRGLASLINTPVEVAPPQKTATGTTSIIENDDIAASPSRPGEQSHVGARSINVGAIVPSRFQPRETFDEHGLAGLAASIRTSGVMQPVLVRRAGDDAGRWELIAGERRWRAAQLAGLDHIPAVIVDIDDQQAAEWALVENVQREDLSAMERARALRGLAERFGVSHGSLGERVGLDRSTVANLIRLTELEPEVQALLCGRDGAANSGGLTTGHGKALLGARPGPSRIALAKRAAQEDWSVRRLEGAVRASLDSDAAPSPAQAKQTDPQVADIERQLSEALGTKVRLATNPDRTRGRIVIEFYGLDHFDGVVRQLGLPLHR